MRHGSDIVYIFPAPVIGYGVLFFAGALCATFLWSAIHRHAQSPDARGIIFSAVSQRGVPPGAPGVICINAVLMLFYFDFIFFLPVLFLWHVSHRYCRR